MFIRYLLLFCFFIPSISIAQEYGSLKVSKIIYVYDGDTFRVDINSLHSIIGKNISIRIAGIDAPEIKGKCKYEKEQAIKARDFVRDKLSKSSEVILTDIQRDKYFRIVANVFIDGQSLKNDLLSSNLARRYNGRIKLTWCD